MRAFRRQAQMIFQDPYESMNPRRTIYDTIAEPLAVQGIGTVMDRVDLVSEILMLVGLTPPTTFPLPPSPRTLRGPAAAGRHRPRPGGGTHLRCGR